MVNYRQSSAIVGKLRTVNYIFIQYMGFMWNIFFCFCCLKAMLGGRYFRRVFPSQAFSQYSYSDRLLCSF